MKKILPRLALVMSVGLALSACGASTLTKSGKEVQHPMVDFSIPHIPSY